MFLVDFYCFDFFIFGIELELQVVNLLGYDFSQDVLMLIVDVQYELIVGEVKYDIIESMLEIVIGVCCDISYV